MKLADSESRTRVRTHIQQAEARLNKIDPGLPARNMFRFIPGEAPPSQGIMSGETNQNGFLLTIGLVGNQRRFVIYPALQIVDSFGNDRNVATESKFQLLAECDPSIQISALDQLTPLIDHLVRFAEKINQLINFDFGMDPIVNTNRDGYVP